MDDGCAADPNRFCSHYDAVLEMLNQYQSEVQPTSTWPPKYSLKKSSQILDGIDIEISKCHFHSSQASSI